MAGNFEILHHLPPELQNLPLYPDDDGFYSVNGPEFRANHSKHPTLHLLDNQTSNPTSKSPHISSYLQTLTNTINKFSIPLSTSLPHSTILTLSPQPRPSLRKLPRREYVCDQPGCTWQSPFKTKQGLARHYEVKHLQKRHDCPIPGCQSVGNRGIKRKDNLHAHMWHQHRVELPGNSFRGCT